MNIMLKYFITSDVHSFFDIFIKSICEKGFDIKNEKHKLIVCGDLFDRGNDSKKLMDFVSSLGDRFIYVRGNHEDLLNDCVGEICSGKTLGEHHFSNGTVKTISQLCDIDEKQFYYVRRSESINQEVWDKMRPVLKWIDDKSVDYCVIGDYIFVHGWIPCAFDNSTNPVKNRNLKLAPKEWWNNEFVWKEARWLNGMDAWKQCCRIEGKTIVCGHWHCSWGHSHIHQDRKEFPDKNRKDWEKSFEPFVDDGIIAIDACTAYSGLCNVITLEVDE